MRRNHKDLIRERKKKLRFYWNGRKPTTCWRNAQWKRRDGQRTKVKCTGLNEGENRLRAKWTRRIFASSRICGVSKETSATNFTDQPLNLLKSGSHYSQSSHYSGNRKPGWCWSLSFLFSVTATLKLLWPFSV